MSVAEDMINGECCSMCGQYFTVKGKSNEVESPDEYNDEGFSHGYPVACNYCWEKDCCYPKQDKNCTT